MANCKSCNAMIIWVTTDSGRKMPLDAEPVVGGNIVLNDDNSVVVLKKEDAADFAERVGEKLYVSHFATCKDASEHRKRA